MDNGSGGEKKSPTIAVIGIGGGGSRILSEGMEKIMKHKEVDRYRCLIKAIQGDDPEPLVYILDTSTDPTKEGFFKNIPREHKVSLSSTIQGMSRGAGGRPGRAAKAVLNKDVSRTLAEKLYKPISDSRPAIVVVIHTADGGTGGGLTPEILQQMAYVLPHSTIFWVFTVLPRQTAIALKGPRTVAVNLGRLLKVTRKISDRDFSQIPYQCRVEIDNTVARGETDQSYEFQHSRLAIFPLSNQHFTQCWKGRNRKEVREEVLNPFPIELLSQALYPFLRYALATNEEQAWMQDHWPLGPIDIPDIMAGITSERPFVIPHLWIDPEGWENSELPSILDELERGIIRLKKPAEEGDGDAQGEEGDGVGALENYTFTGCSAKLFEFRATSMYCIPIYPEGSKYFDDFGDMVSDVWFPELSGRLNYIGGRKGSKTGVISHAANLKPQPIPRREGSILGFENGLLVTLLYGIAPTDMAVWLEAAGEIIDQHKTMDLWELNAYDAMDWLRELALYMGWDKWPEKNYLEDASAE